MFPSAARDDRAVFNTADPDLARREPQSSGLGMQPKRRGDARAPLRKDGSADGQLTPELSRAAAASYPEPIMPELGRHGRSREAASA